MSDLDSLIQKQPPEVVDAINRLIDMAGTSDADWQILVTAGQLISELEKQIAINRHRR